MASAFAARAYDKWQKFSNVAHKVAVLGMAAYCCVGIYRLGKLVFDKGIEHYEFLQEFNKQVEERMRVTGETKIEAEMSLREEMFLTGAQKVPNIKKTLEAIEQEKDRQQVLNADDVLRDIELLEATTDAQPQ
ncbi:MAG: hypothetical protein MHM6MM_001317 [Cercozoa sp. M6MM]